MTSMSGAHVGPYRQHWAPSCRYGPRRVVDWPYLGWVGLHSPDPISTPSFLKHLSLNPQGCFKWDGQTCREVWRGSRASRANATSEMEILGGLTSSQADWAHSSYGQDESRPAPGRVAIPRGVPPYGHSILLFSVTDNEMTFVMLKCGTAHVHSSFQRAIPRFCKLAALKTSGTVTVYGADGLLVQRALLFRKPSNIPGDSTVTSLNFLVYFIIQRLH